MDEQPVADDVYPNGKRAIDDVFLDDDGGNNKRLCVGFVPSGEWGEVSTQSWMHQTVIPDTAFLSGALQPPDPESWNYFPNDQNMFLASDGLGQLPGVGLGESYVPGFDTLTDTWDGVGFLPPVEALPGTFCDYQGAGAFVVEQGAAMEEVEIQTEETPRSNWLLDPTKQSSEATTPLTSATPVPDGKPPELTSGGVSNVELAQVESMEDEVSQPSVECDVCFGVIVVNALLSTQRQPEDGNNALVVSPCGKILKLSFKSSGKYAGIINSEPLAKLLRNFSTQITASTQRPAKTAGKVGSKKSDSKPAVGSSSSQTPVRLLVCGLMAERDAVRDLTSDHELFFQHPLPNEVTSSILGLQYFNPHLLIRPGSKMPDLASLSLCGVTDISSAEVLDDVSKARLMRVFDLASDPTVDVEVKPSPRLKTALKRHQLSALAMMTERECGVIDTARYPTLWDRSARPNGDACYRHRITGAKQDSPRPHRGGILADEMGLGKTLSTLALICWSLDSRHVDDDESCVKGCRQTLVVTPKSTLPGWQEQIQRFIKRGHLKTTVFYGSNRSKQAEKADACDVVFTTYQTLRSDWSGDQLLYSKQWARIVLDEAHHIRTRSTDLFKAACALEAPFRWCLTGTPIQNSLDDYSSLVSFIRVDPFTSKSAFDSMIALPLKGQGKEKLRSLEYLVRATCLRRTKEQLGGQESGLYLPPRTEKMEWVDLSTDDREIYEFFKARTAEIASGMSKDHRRAAVTTDRGRNIICLINFLRLICDHGESLLPSSAVEIWKSRASASIGWEMMQTMNEKGDCCYFCGAKRMETPGVDVDEEALESQGTGCLCEVQGDLDISGKGIAASNKILALVRNLYEEQRGRRDVNAESTKSVIFSCWTKMLDLVQHILGKEQFIVVRIDGRKSLKERTEALYRFKNDPTCTVMLASIGSAGEGIDLTAATCVHLLEPHWNPMAEAQAVDRVHRIGQRRPVTTTRYVTRSSIETYVQWVQRSKIKVINESLSGGLDGEPRERVEDQRWKKLQEFLQGAPG